MATLNKVMLIGRLTADVETKDLQSGKKVANIRFVVSQNKKNKQTGQWENDPNPMYIDATVFSNDTGGGLFNVVQYMSKGTECYLGGRLTLETWEDKNGGGKRSKHKLLVDEIQLLGAKGASGEPTAIDFGSRVDGGGSPAAPVADEEIPF